MIIAASIIKKLYEFTALLECAYIVAADNEKSARKAIETYEKTWFESGDFIGVSDIQLVNVSVVDGGCYDEAHEVV